MSNWFVRLSQYSSASDLIMQVVHNTMDATNAAQQLMSTDVNQACERIRAMSVAYPAANGRLGILSKALGCNKMVNPQQQQQDMPQDQASDLANAVNI